MVLTLPDIFDILVPISNISVSIPLTLLSVLPKLVSKSETSVSKVDILLSNPVICSGIWSISSGIASTLLLNCVTCSLVLPNSVSNCVTCSGISPIFSGIVSTLVDNSSTLVDKPLICNSNELFKPWIARIKLWF